MFNLLSGAAVNTSCPEGAWRANGASGGQMLQMAAGEVNKE